MWIRRSFIAGAILLAFACVFGGGPNGAAYAQTIAPAEPTAIVAGMPRSFYGLFLWRKDGTTAQAVEVKILQVRPNDAGFVTAQGIATYTDADGPAKVRMAITIEAKSLKVSIREFQPQGSDTMVTDGKHVGRISRDLRRISAMWTTRSDGARGDLMLIGVKKESPS